MCNQKPFISDLFSPLEDGRGFNQSSFHDGDGNKRVHAADGEEQGQSNIFSHSSSFTPLTLFIPVVIPDHRFRATPRDSKSH
jgi:hypothetical protein